jgi:hypothetical protein
MKSKKHIIYKCLHRPFPFKIKGLNRIEDYIFKKTFRFTESCRYNLYTEDQYDWNKLYGVSFGIFGIHKNSARFVWRYDLVTQKIEIGAYWYIDGYRNYYTLCSVEINDTINFKMTFLHDSIVFTVLDDLMPISKYVLYMNENILKKNRYECGIYFGGNRRAPQRIEIKEYEY